MPSTTSTSSRAAGRTWMGRTREQTWRSWPTSAMTSRPSGRSWWQRRRPPTTASLSWAKAAMTTAASLLWEPVHGEPRVPLPALPELVTLLLAMGRLPQVTLAERTPPAFGSLEELLAMCRRQLWVRPDSSRDRRLVALATVAGLPARGRLGPRLATLDDRDRVLGGGRTRRAGSRATAPRPRSADHDSRFGREDQHVAESKLRPAPRAAARACRPGRERCRSG